MLLDQREIQKMGGRGAGKVEWNVPIRVKIIEHDRGFVVHVCTTSEHFGWWLTTKGFRRSEEGYYFLQVAFPRDVFELLDKLTLFSVIESVEYEEKVSGLLRRASR